MVDVLVARRSSKGVLGDGTRYRVHRGRTLAQADSDIVAERPDLWEPLALDFPAPEPEHEPEPTAKEVRAWAKEQGLDAPAKGKLPADLVARYKAEAGG